MSENIFLSVIIPAYNEEKRLPETLKKVRAYLKNQTYTSEVYVVNDGSTDETAKVTSELIEGWDGFKLISYEKNRGKGYAVKTGMLAAEGQWRLLMDADGSTAISELEKLLPFTGLNPKHEIRSTKQYLNQENPNKKTFKKLEFNNSNLFRISNFVFRAYEVIIGSRYLDTSSIKIKQPLSRRIISRLGNIIIRILLGIKSVDTQCGFKLFSKEAAEKIFPKQTIDRWGFDVEILAIATHQKYKIKEVAVDWYDAEGSQVKKSAALKTLKEIRQIKRNLMRGKY